VHQLLFYLLLVLLPTQLGFHFWPDWALVLGRRVDYLSPTLYFTDILIFLLLVSWNKISISWKIVIPICIFAALNTYFSISRPVAIYYWLKCIEFGLLGFYIIKAKPAMSLVSSALSLAILYSSILAIWQFAIQHSIGGLFWFFGERTFSGDTSGIAQISLGSLGLKLRAYATFPHPNVLGGFLAIVLPLLVIQKKKVYLPAIILGIIALVLSFSRAAWIVGGIGIVYSVLCMVYERKMKYTIRYTLYSILFVMSLLCIGVYVYFFPSMSDESVVVRQQLNVSAIHIWKSHPLIGVGLGNFLVVLPDFLPSRVIYFLQPVHNIYLLLLSEIGVIGGIGVIGVIWKIRKRVVCPLSLVSVFLLGLVDHYFLTLQQGQLLLTIIISLYLVIQYDHAPDANSRRVEHHSANHR
jgi:hypothetical protein